MHKDKTNENTLHVYSFKCSIRLPVMDLSWIYYGVNVWKQDSVDELKNDRVKV